MDRRTREMTGGAVFAALIALATLFFRIPLPMANGYCHPGDGLVLLSGVLSPGWAAAASAVGSALADVLGGAAVYAPATVLIKGTMGLIAARIMARAMPLPKRAAALLIPEAVMALGYFAFESLLYGPGAAVLSLPGNGCQAAVSIAAATALIGPIQKALRKR